MQKLILILLISIIQTRLINAQSLPYKVGAILPLSGQVSNLGKFVQNGINLAYKNLDSTNKDKLEIIFEDDEFDPKKTISAYQKLKSTKNIDAVFVLGSPTANAINSITEKDKVILIAIGASDPNIVIGKKYSFIHWVTPDSLGEKLAKEIAKKKFKRIAFIVAEVSGCIADSQATIKYLKEAGYEEKDILEKRFIKDTTDYRSVLTQIKKQKYDAIVAVLFSGALSSFAKQLKELKVESELIGMETFEDEDEVKASNGAMLNSWFVNASDYTDQFKQLYRKEYGQHPGWATGNAFDSVNLIAEGVKINGNDNSKIKDFISELKNYQGATGTYSTSGDNRFTLPATVKKVTATGFEIIE